MKTVKLEDIYWNQPSKPIMWTLCHKIHTPANSQTQYRGHDLGVLTDIRPGSVIIYHYIFIEP